MEVDLLRRIVRFKVALLDMPCVDVAPRDTHWVALIHVPWVHSGAVQLLQKLILFSGNYTRKRILLCLEIPVFQYKRRQAGSTSDDDGVQLGVFSKKRTLDIVVCVVKEFVLDRISDLQG